MDKKSKVLITVFVLALLVALGYSHYRYILTGDFLIDETQVEPEEIIDEAPEEMLPENGDGTESAEMKLESRE